MTPDPHEHDSRDPEFAELEAMLRQAPLRRPSAALDGRIAAACCAWGAAPRLWLVVAAAAMVAVTAGAWAVWQEAAKRAGARASIVKVEPWPHAASAATIPASISVIAKPVSMSRTFRGVARDGIVGRTADGQPVERFRRQTVRQIVIFDPQRGTRLTISVPHEDVLVVPVKTF